MERLQALLRDYISSHASEFHAEEWVTAYLSCTFPIYWRTIYSITEKLPRNLKVLEIGSGFGFITSIFKYLRYENVIGYEYDDVICRTGNLMLNTLFGADNIIQPSRFVDQSENADILVLVNCAYADDCTTKEEYKSILKSYYKNTDYPKYYILEVIDSSYTKQDVVFPDFIRLSRDDIDDMFPNCHVQSWQTYRYPINKKSKTLYLIEKP